MKLELKRIARKATYTIGHLYIDGERFCDTIEDKDRGLEASMPLETLQKMKVYGKTAIPTGTYKIDMNTISAKFRSRPWATPYNGKLPRLLDVPAFDGVLIHPGNTPEDTLGCILVGENKAVGQVINSVETFKRLMETLKGASDITLTIK